MDLGRIMKLALHQSLSYLSSINISPQLHITLSTITVQDSLTYSPTLYITPTCFSTTCRVISRGRICLRTLSKKANATSLHLLLYAGAELVERK